MSPGKVEERQLSFKRLHDTFGVEVEGIDWSKLPLDESVINEIREAITREGVLVFREANLDNERHIAFTRQLSGSDDLYDVKAHIKAGRAMRFPETPEIFDVSNLDDKWNIVTATGDPMRHEGNKGNFIWHADMTYNPHRGLYSILRSVQLPPKGTGGETDFLDSRTACEELPDSLRKELEASLGPLEEVVTHNSLMHNRKLGSPEYFASVEPLDQPMAKYRLLTPHEKSGRPNLYMTSYAHHFEGLSLDDSKPLFDKIFAHLTQPKYKLTVYWENNGDMVAWDNTAVLHRATASGTYAEKYVRDMRRCTSKDDSVHRYGVNEDHTWEAGISKVKAKSDVTVPVQDHQ